MAEPALRTGEAGAQPLRETRLTGRQASASARQAGPSSSSRAAVLPAPPDSAAAPVCRICWEGETPAPGGRLLAPCACTGTCAYIHAGCLDLWQRTQRGQRAYAKAQRCEVCHARYRLPRAAKAGRGGPLPAAQAAWEALLAFSQGGAWAGLARTLRAAIILGGLTGSLRVGGLCLGRGARMGAILARGSLTGPLRYAPEMALVAAAFPSLQGPLVLAAGLLVAASAAQVVAGALVGAYVGGIAGFGLGSFSTVHLVAALGHSALVTSWRAGAAAALVLARSLRLAGALLPPAAGGALRLARQVCFEIGSAL